MHFSIAQHVLIAPQDQSAVYKGLTNPVLPAGHLTMCNGQFVLRAFALLKQDPINPSCDLWPAGSAT